MEDQAVDVVDEVGECDLGLGSSVPMVRMKSAIWFFCRAKTCSMRARTVDLAALARAVRAGIGLPLGFLRWTRLTRQIDFIHASLGRLRYAVSADTSDAVLSLVTTSRSMRLSKRAPSVTLPRRIKP